MKPAGLAQSSKQTGNWNDVGSWLSNNVPTLSDAVTINTGHTVTILNGQSGSAGSLTDKGLLSIQTGGQFNVGKINANTLQNVDFSYKIRGGLKGINLDASGNPVLAGGDLFAMKLGYEDDGTYFDGNIRSQTWISSIDNLSRTYTYRYDGASRIKAGVYSGGKPNENYTLNDVTYDNSGNIKKLIRNGLRANTTFGMVDNLSYTYQANSNKIQAVSDISGETASFTDVAGATDYTYNPDGSLKSDANKGITLIDYNYLKLPKKVTFLDGKTISYQYLASGKKLKETTSTGEITDYIGNIIYKNTTVYQIGHDEGRCVPKTTGDYTYEYDIIDHLGSLRVSFKDSVGIAKVTQESHTGVFGDILPSLVYTNTPKVDNFDYTEHERLKTFNLGYIDAGARWYDPLVPRFTTIDPLTETSRRFSPFTYGNNNPIRFIDPDGMESKEFEYSNGYVNSNSRDNTGAVTFEGSYLNGGAGNSSGGNNDDKPKVNSSSKNNTTYKGGTRLLGTTTNGDKKDPFIAGGLALAAGLAADDVTGIGVADDVAIPFVLAGVGIYSFAKSDILKKLQKETESLLRRTLGGNEFTYVLVTTITGNYNVYSRGSSAPTGTVPMGAGEIWKIGETTSNERYDPAYLLKEKVMQVPVFYGNQLDIKIKEKLLIYGYFFNSGKLPPGNKIFR